MRRGRCQADVDVAYMMSKRITDAQEELVTRSFRRLIRLC